MRINDLSLSLFLSLFCVFSACQSVPKEPTAFDLLLAKDSLAFDTFIQGGKIIDGTGDSAYEADLLIRDDSIVFIGQIDPKRIKVNQTIDAKGKVVSPGFIDPHAHGDPLRQPEFHNFLAMGVTSISLGQDGWSEPVDDITQWMDTLDQLRTGVNIMPFIGHGTLREKSGIRFKKNPSDAELDTITQLLEKALRGGCWGMSTGLEYTPGMYAGEEELAKLAQMVGKYNGMIMSHMRNEDDEALEQSIHELLLQGRHCRVHVSHMKAVYGKGAARADQLLAILDSARSAGITVTADVYPYPASFTTIGILFPSWSRPPYSYSSVRRLKRKQLEDFLRKRVARRNGPAATLFGTKPWVGKTLQEVATETGKPFEAVLIDDIGPSGASAAYFVMDTTLQERLIQDDFTMVCSDGSSTMQHPRGYGSYAKVLEDYVFRKQLFSLETAIHKMSGLTAKSMKLSGRGTLAPGKKADILVFQPKNIHAHATFEDPHQLATGMDVVMVNGQVVLKNGEFVTERHGQVLRFKR